MLSLDGVQVAALSGDTTNGEWLGEYFFKENISTPGEYDIDIILSYLGETVSKSSTFFVIGTTTASDSTNHAPIANAGSDQSHEDGVAGFTLGVTAVNLDGSTSTDPDGDPITFSWVFTSVPNTSTVTLSGETTATPSFVPDLVGTYDIQLTVSDGRKSSTDSVTITVV